MVMTKTCGKDSTLCRKGFYKYMHPEVRITKKNENDLVDTGNQRSVASRKFQV
ncbi:hypothetical protein [Marinifilum sp. D737]|uniref:hypothetical protein n=1 Tax=Marinifilum sp. D737 TaxID=2969628 RepID=UPI002275BC07|nr:hypothetical protein [Marinifilum sp. D737]MCY1633756.1 hypothetical protein [Marinifilum sp. D737]